MSDWTDYGDDDATDDRQPIGTGELDDGGTLTLAFEAEPETFESDDYGEGVRADAVFLDSTHDYEDDDGDAIANGDEVRLITWSARLVRALADAHGSASIVGDAFEISKDGEGMSVQYRVDRIDESGD